MAVAGNDPVGVGRERAGEHMIIVGVGEHRATD